MVKNIAIAVSLIALTGCQISTNALNPKYGSYNHLLRKDADSYCDSFGCGKDLEFYQFAEGEAQRRADKCEWEWGQTSSAHAPGTDEYKRLRAEEEKQGTVPGLCQ
jgi:hypothetical protein